MRGRWKDLKWRAIAFVAMFVVVTGSVRVVASEPLRVEPRTLETTAEFEWFDERWTLVAAKTRKADGWRTKLSIRRGGCVFTIFPGDLGLQADLRPDRTRLVAEDGLRFTWRVEETDVEAAQLSVALSKDRRAVKWIEVPVYRKPSREESKSDVIKTRAARKALRDMRVPEEGLPKPPGNGPRWFKERHELNLRCGQTWGTGN